MGAQRWCFLFVFFKESWTVCLPVCRGSIWNLASSLFTFKGCCSNLRIHMGKKPLSSAEPSYKPPILPLMEGWQSKVRSGRMALNEPLTEARQRSNCFKARTGRSLRILTISYQRKASGRTELWLWDTVTQDACASWGNGWKCAALGEGRHSFEVYS